MKMCSKCGHQIADGVNTCCYCGNGYKDPFGVQKEKQLQENLMNSSKVIERKMSKFIGIPQIFIGACMILFCLGVEVDRFTHKGEITATLSDIVDCGEEFCDAVYTFEVDGETYTFVDPFADSEPSQTVDVSYNLKDPSDCINHSDSALIFGVIGAVFLFIGLSLIKKYK